jgi:hypothetical protein
MIESPPRWNKDLIERLFIPFEGILIQQIHITIRRYPDSLMWMFNENGEYTVKTGYNALQQ